MTPTLATSPAATLGGALGSAARNTKPTALWPGSIAGVRASIAAQHLDQAAFGLLLLAAGDLLFRPADLVPALAGAPIHKLLLIACTLLAMPRLVGMLAFRMLRQNAVAALLILLVPAVLLSHLAHADVYGARMGGAEMAKSCLFAILVIALVDSPRRLRFLLAAIAATVFAVAALAVAHHHGLVHLAALTGVEQVVSGPEGRTTLTRLCGIGLFNDPNDFSLVLVLAMVVCGYGLGERRAGAARGLLLVPLGVLAYALFLTHSRGGALSGVAALGALVAARAGWRNTLLLAAPACVVLLVPLYVRQMNLNLADPEDTFQARLRLWSGSLDAFCSAPVFGIGEGRLVDEIGQVAHNSFLHAFAEMGLVGGMLFLGGFLLVGRGVWRVSPLDGQLARVRPYVLAIVIGYVVGLLSLSRCYAATTQLVLALGTAFLVIASKDDAAALPRLDWRCLRGIAVVGAVFLAATSLFIHLMLVQVEP